MKLITTKSIKKLLNPALVLASLLFCQVAYAELAIIVHPSNNSNMSQDEISKVFLGKSKSFSNGETALPVNQKGNPLDTFNTQVLKKSSSQIKAYWSKLIFTGKGTPPKDLDNDAEVKKMVANNPNVIGYIDASKVDGSVKVVLKI